MISLKVLSAAAATALVLSAIVPTESFAQNRPHGGGASRGGGAAFHGGGRGGAPGPRFSGGGPRFNGGGGGYRRGGGAFIPGAIAGAVIGGAIASQGPYYGGQPYYGGGSYYYDDDYADGPVVQVAPGGGGDVDYCIQTYRSYDPRSGTYLGNDGYRHPCP